MPRKRKVNYPPPKTATKRAPLPGPDPNIDRPNLARINLDAGAGRAGLTVGDRVRIEAGGLYSGETAVIERLSTGVIPSALVRTDGGGTRQVRTIDLVPAAAAEPAAAVEPAAVELAAAPEATTEATQTATAKDDAPAAAAPTAAAPAPKAPAAKAPAAKKPK